MKDEMTYETMLRVVEVAFARCDAKVTHANEKLFISATPRDELAKCRKAVDDAVAERNGVMRAVYDILTGASV